MVCAGCTRPVVVEAIYAMRFETRLGVDKGIVKTFQNRLFYVLFKHTSTILINLPKNLKVTTLGEPPSKTFSVPEESVNDSINAMPLYRGRRDSEGP